MISTAFRTPDYIQRGVARTLTLTVYASDGTPTLNATGSSFSLYNAAGDAVLSAEAVTVSGATASYALGSPTLNAEDYGDGWREVWILVVNGTTQTFERPAALVRVPLWSTLHPGSLSAVHSELPRVATWVVDGVETTWEAYAWTKLDYAWERLLRRLTQDGRLPARIPTLSLSDYHEALTFEVIFRDVMGQQGDRYERLLKDWSDRVKAIESAAVLEYDLDDDGRPDAKIIGIGTAPRTYGGGWPWFGL